MAWHYVREGWVAVVVDNAGAGEQGDAERAAGRASHDYDNLARLLLEMDWSWLGYTSYTDQCILNWVKKLPFIQKNHIILSGFSLGTEPMMVLGVLNPDIYAFVYNDFLCRTLERAQTMTKPSANGSRPAPNSIRHLIPGFWQQFDFPDIVASLAPRPVICTEGGLDRDFGLIAQAYRMAGREDAFRFLHQPRFADPAKRWQGERLPSGLDRTPNSSAWPTSIRATTSSKKTPSSRGSKASWTLNKPLNAPQIHNNRRQPRNPRPPPKESGCPDQKPAREAAVSTSCRNRRNAAVCSGVLNLPKTCRDKAASFTLSRNPSVISVSRNPGKTRFTRIPFFPHSRARLLTRPSRADLEAAYAAWDGAGLYAA